MLVYLTKHLGGVGPRLYFFNYKEFNMKTLFTLILISLSSLCFGQSTFTKWISTEENETLWRMEKIDNENTLVVIGRGDWNNSLEFFFNLENVFYIINSDGQFTDSLVTNKIENYEIILSNVVRIDEEGFLCAANALHVETLDEQLCLFWLDQGLNITNYSFHGSPDVDEVVTDYIINHKGNIVFTGINNFEGPDGQTFFWEFDPGGNELNFIIDTTFLSVAPSILQLPGNEMYHVIDFYNCAIYNNDFEKDTVISLENTSFATFPQRHIIVDDFHYLKIGYILNPPAPVHFDMALLLMDENFQIETLNSYGAIDTTDFGNSVSFISTDYIFLCGIKNSEVFPLDDGWIALYKTNLSGEIFYSRFYGGYGYYYGVQSIATQKGGCLLAANYWDFHNWVPGEPQNYDVIIMKLNADGLLTNISSPVPFEQTDILVYPNPGNEYLKIESCLENLTLNLYDTKGEVVLVKDFDKAITIETHILFPGQYFYTIYQGQEIKKSGIWIKK